MAVILDATRAASILKSEGLRVRRQADTCLQRGHAVLVRLDRLTIFHGVPAPNFHLATI